MVIMKTMLLAVGMLLIGCGSDPAQGPQGEQGRAGAIGAVGAQGPAGAKGEPGAAGKDGAQGPAGKDGVGGTLSGSRLKAQRLVGSDGSSTFVGWFDSTTGDACQFGVATDGKMRCLPSVSAAAVYFLDAACSQPTVAVYDASGQPPPAPAAYTHTKNGVERYIKVGPPAADPAELFHTPVGGPCTLVNTPDLTKLFFYDGSLLDPSEFIEGSVQTD